MRQPFPPDSRLLYPRDALSAANGDGLSNIIVDDLPDGAMCYVTSEGLYILEKYSNSAVSSPDVVATGRGAAAPGRWVLFQAGASIDPPLRNTLYVDPNSTVVPQTGTILAPYTSVQDAIDAVTDDSYWQLILSPGSDFQENLVVPGARNIELNTPGWDGTAGISGNISWDPDGGSLALTGVWVVGDITGTATENGAYFVMNQAAVFGDVLIAYSGPPEGLETRAYLSGDNNIDHLSGEDINVITGAFSCPGRVYATLFQFRGTISCQFLTCVDAWCGGLAATTITIEAGGARFITTSFHEVDEIVCVGDDPQQVNFDQFSANSFSSVAGQITGNFVVGLVDSDVKFGGMLPDADSDIDPADGALFWIQDTTAVRDYTILPGTKVNQTVFVECRDHNNTPNLNNGGGTPGLIVAMDQAFGYAAAWNGTDWIGSMVYGLPPT